MKSTWGLCLSGFMALAAFGAAGVMTACEVEANEVKPPADDDDPPEEVIDPGEKEEEESTEYRIVDAPVYALNGFVKYAGSGVIKVTVSLGTSSTESSITIDVGKVEKGRLTLNLPEVDDKMLQYLDGKDLSKRGLYLGQNDFSLYDDAGKKLGDLSYLKREYGSGTSTITTVMFLYASKDMDMDDVVSTLYYNDDYEEVPLEVTSHINAKAGWNPIVFKNVSSLTKLEAAYTDVMATLTGVKWLLDVSAAAKTNKADWENSVVYDNDAKTKLLGVSPLQTGSAPVPTTVTEIGDYALAGCTKLSSVSMKAGLKTIGNYAFQSCRNLDSVDIPDSVTKIGSGAFAGLDIEKVTIGAGGGAQGTVIGDHAFFKCTLLTTVKIAEGVTGIERYAFSGCPQLNSVTIPASVKSIGHKAFYANKDGELTLVTFLGDATEVEEGSFPAASSNKLKDVYEAGGAGTYEWKPTWSGTILQRSEWVKKTEE